MARDTNSPQTFWRYWLMLSQLPRSPRRVAASTLRAHLESHGITIDIRSIQRDLLKLSAYFPIEHDDTKPRGWSFAAQSTRFDLPGMDAHSAIAFRLVETYLKNQLPRTTLAALEPHFQTAQTVLKTLKKRGLPSWTKKIHVSSRSQPLTPPKVHEDVLHTVYDALLEEKSLRIRYRGRDDTKKSKEAEVHPQGLIFRESVAYLAVTFWDYDDVRLLALHRMDEAQMTGTKRRVLADFSLEDFAKTGVAHWKEGDKQIRLVIRLEPEAAYSVTETPLTENQIVKKRNDGRVQVEAMLPNTRVLHAWLRSFGSKVEVVKPLSLRKQMLREAEALVERYQRKS